MPWDSTNPGCCEKRSSRGKFFHVLMGYACWECVYAFRFPLEDNAERMNPFCGVTLLSVLLLSFLVR